MLGNGLADALPCADEEARTAAPFGGELFWSGAGAGAGLSRGVTRGSGLVICMISRRMPGRNDAGLTITCGRDIGPWIANVMPITPSPRGPARMMPRIGKLPIAELGPCSGT